MYVSMGAFFDGGLSELFEGVPVPVPVRYRSEREPELEESGAIGQISPAGRTPGPGFGHVIEVIDLPDPMQTLASSRVVI